MVFVNQVSGFIIYFKFWIRIIETHVPVKLQRHHRFMLIFIFVYICPPNPCAATTCLVGNKCVNKGCRGECVPSKLCFISCCFPYIKVLFTLSMVDIFFWFLEYLFHIKNKYLQVWNNYKKHLSFEERKKKGRVDFYSH